MDVASPALLPDRVDTARLVLRRWRHDEASLLDAAIRRNREHLRPWMSWIAKEPMTLAERIDLIETWTRSWEGGDDSFLGVFLDGEVVGGTGLHRRVGPQAIEIGYWIDVAHLRRGYATELTEALTTTALARSDVDRVVIHTDEANVASAAVPERLGFRRDGIDVRTPLAPAETGRMIVWTTDVEHWQACRDAREDRPS